MSSSARINGSPDYPPLNYAAHLCPGQWRGFVMYRNQKYHRDKDLSIDVSAPIALVFPTYLPFQFNFTYRDGARRL